MVVGVGVVVVVVGVGVGNPCFKSLANKNIHNLRSKSDIDMKLEPLSKIDKRNTMMSTKIRQ